jgi:hypothetical protein
VSLVVKQYDPAPQLEHALAPEAEYHPTHKDIVTAVSAVVED